MLDHLSGRACEKPALTPAKGRRDATGTSGDLLRLPSMSPLLIQVFLVLQAQAYTGEMNWTCEEAERKLRVSVSYRGTAKCCVAKTYGGTDWREDSLPIPLRDARIINYLE